MTRISAGVKDAKRASITMASLSTDIKNNALSEMAKALDAKRTDILDANRTDMSKAYGLLKNGELTQPMADRLKITEEKIDGMISGIHDVINLKDPVGEIMERVELDSGLVLEQMRCPIGVVGVIFESRPDVVPQIMSLCLKSGNAVIFKGGSEAYASNRMLFDILSDAAASKGVPREAFCIMESREEINTILEMDEYIDLLVPRGSNSFVRYIQNNTRIPVLGHAAGICHVYVDAAADIRKAVNVVLDSKTQYPAVCNAAETLIVDSAAAETFLPVIAKEFLRCGVEMRADEKARRIIGKEAKAASEEDWDEEYNDMIISIRVTGSVEEAIDFINTHGSGHTDAIVSENTENISKFIGLVDSANVFVNASTRFSDGFRYGKGAEVGVSTNKIHARGPVGMEGLTIYKYILRGDGHVVKDYIGNNAKRFTHRRL